MYAAQGANRGFLTMFFLGGKLNFPKVDLNQHDVPNDDASAALYTGAAPAPATSMM